MKAIMDPSRKYLLRKKRECFVDNEELKQIRQPRDYSVRTKLPRYMREDFLKPKAWIKLLRDEEKEKNQNQLSSKSTRTLGFLFKFDFGLSCA